MELMTTPSLLTKVTGTQLLSMVLNVVVCVKQESVRNTDRQRKRCWIAIIVCPFPVSFPKGDNLMSLVIKLCHLVKMSRIIVPFRVLPSFGAFLLE